MPFVWVCDYWLKNAHGIPIGGCNLNENKLFKYFSSNNLTWQHSTELYMAHEAFGMKERNMAGNTAQSSSVSVCYFKLLGMHKLLTDAENCHAYLYSDMVVCGYS